MSPQIDEKSTPPEQIVEPGTPSFNNDSKDVKTEATVELAYADSNEELHRPSVVADSAEALVTQVISVEDDPTMNALTFRMFFLGIGLSVFASVLQEIFFFKPQTVYVSTVFLTVIAYILGEAMSLLIPRWGPIGKFLNPFPFNLKEHAAITLMASAGGQSAQATQALAAQQLFYGGYPSRAAGIFVVLSSQLIGYGLAGLLRTVLVYPTKMLWPMNLPISSLLETLHKDKVQSKQRLKIFYIVFFILFVWEVFPQYIFTVLEGLSIFCLAQQNSLVFTNLFGGSSGNEGLGFLSISFDWQFIAPFWSPLWYPLQTLTNNFIGYLGCILVFMVVYYRNIWDAQNYPFLSQLLFSDQSNSTNYVLYNQTNILTADNVIDPALLYKEGIPAMTATYLVYLITSNMGLTAALTHMFLWNREDLKASWEWVDYRKISLLTQASTWQFWKNIESPEERLARKEADPKLDPHYKLMLRNMYRESPLWWWGALVVISWVVGLGCLYAMNSTLPWWGFVLATILTCIFMLFLGAQMGLTGFQFNVQPIAQMIGGYLFPNRPIANMYFTCYTFNTLQMGQVLCKDLKLAQQIHLAPRITFVMQVMGCIIGALFNFLMMIVIVDNQAPILSSIEGSNIWSGQLIQQFNTLAISWSIAGDMFSVGAKYQWVTISFLLGFIVPVPFWLAHKFFPKFRLMAYLNTSIILWYMGNLFVGVNSGFLSYFVIGFISQFYLRKYHPQFFIKYNYIVSAALDGGSQVMVFILTFAVFGGSGNAVPFPTWAGNPDRTVRNLDYCMLNPANAG